MTMNPLPPQAYTKDILLKAYNWLMGQNTSIKEMATTPDILVSLYLKATRDGDHSLDRPSIQNFKNELRNLAGMMGELDRPQNSQAHPNKAPLPNAGASYASHHTAPPVVNAAPVVEAPTPGSQAHGSASSHANGQTSQTQVSYTEKTMTAVTRKTDLFEQLDAVSRAMIHEVKEELNLSSEVEALRMLIKIGYTRSKSLLT